MLVCNSVFFLKSESKILLAKASLFLTANILGIIWNISWFHIIFVMLWEGTKYCPHASLFFALPPPTPSCVSLLFSRLFLSSVCVRACMSACLIFLRMANRYLILFFYGNLFQEDLNQAISMVSYYASSSEPAQIRGKTVYLQYSNRQEVVNNKSSGDVASNVLLVTFEGVEAGDVSIDVLHLVSFQS